MEIKIMKGLCETCDARVVWIYEDETYESKASGNKSIIDYAVNTEQFKGKLGKVQSFKLPQEEKPNKFILIGLGKKDELDEDRLRMAVAKAIKEGNKINAKVLLIEPICINDKITLENSTRILAEIPLLADYKFDNYQEEKKDSSIEEIHILCRNDNDFQTMEFACKEGVILGTETIYARDLVNEPANVLVPIELANRAEKTGNKYGFEVEIFDENKIEELEMKAYMSVAKASDNPPRFIVMRYFGNNENKEEVLGLAGKGLTYDSGGLCIKSPKGMMNMRADMGGAAAVIGAMSAIAQLKLKVNVVAVVAACENMVSGKGYRTGDIIGSMGGKTIFVGSTDAEGRLTLIDAVHYLIEKENVSKVLDIATLTGAAGATLGDVATPILSNDDEFYGKLEKASSVAGEKIWRMPCFEEYRELLKSNVADLTNAAGRPGTITAGMFIGEFVQDKSWIHMDIAATSWADKGSDYSTEGGTGVGVRTLYQLCKALSTGY